MHAFYSPRDKQLLKIGVYFPRYNVLEISDDVSIIGGINWKMFGCMAAAWALVFICLSKGIKSSGKASCLSGGPRVCPLPCVALPTPPLLLKQILK